MNMPVFAFQGTLRLDYFSTKARELMCHIDYLVSCSEETEKSAIRARFSDGATLEKAQSLLKNTDLSIDDISASVGYGHASGFRQAFRKHYGVSPKTVRYQ